MAIPTAFMTLAILWDVFRVSLTMVSLILPDV